MLKLIDITKDYIVGKNLKTRALKGISLDFGDKGFVAILGQSGCGKTTLLNIISGLDRYTSGDLIIDGKSTKEYKDRDWDDYRNKKIGIIFQSYNLIPHLSIIENTELSLTLAGISPKEKKDLAMRSLEKVGLKDQAKKNPNQLSGGQQQRVAIARAIVSNPSIVLADEPTGALDSDTSVQVMDILHSISQEHLVIMVTHNETLAYKYADRIIRMKDGLIIGDTLNEEKIKIGDSSKVIAPVAQKNIFNQGIKTEEQEPVYTYDATKESTESEVQNNDQAFEVEMKAKKSRMSFVTALMMSLKNLMTKKGRTIITAVASSFGIIGVGLVLAISGGFSDYVSRMETQTLSKFPISIEGYGLSAANSNSNENNTGNETENLSPYPNDGNVYIRDPGRTLLHINDITSDYYDAFLKGGRDSYGRQWSGLDKSLYASIQNNYSISANVISKSVDDNGEERYTAIDTSPKSMLATLTTTSYWSELPGDEQYISETYDLLPGGRYPQASNEVVITVNRYNQISTTTLNALGINPEEFKNADGTYSTLGLNELGNLQFKLVSNDDFYIKAEASVDAPTYVGLGLRGAGQGNQDNPYAFPKFIKYLTNGIEENSSEEETRDYMLGLLNFFVPVDIIENMDPIQQIEWFNKINQLRSDLQKAQDRTQQIQIIQTFYNDNEVEINQLFGEGEVNVISQQLPTYSKPRTNTELKAAFDSPNAKNIKIVGVLRQKEGTALGLLGDGVYFLPSLTQEVLNNASQSEIAKNNDKNYFFIDLLSLGTDVEANTITPENYLTINYQKYFKAYNILQLDGVTKGPSELASINDYSSIRTSIGSDTSVGSITIYPIDFKTKEKLIEYLNLYNTTPKADGRMLEEKDQIIFTDVSAMISDSIGTMVSMTSTVLICFASISLVVSSVMIGIIIYVSVLERTKEIGILRSVGARKKDIGRLFKMESVAIGFMAGVIGVVMTYLISIPINIIVNNIYSDYDIGNIASLRFYYALILITVSSLLTYISGLFPSRSAAKKNPVKCLRSE